MRVVKPTLLIETTLVLLAIGIALVAGIDQRDWFNTHISICLVSAICAIILAYAVMQGLAAKGFLNSQFGRDLVKFIALIGKQPISILVVISIAAGVGEELLFRGVLQPLAIDYFGVVIGIISVSILFGLCHAISMAYFFYSMAVSIALSVFYYLSQDLIAAMVFHAMYDFVALYFAVYRLELHLLATDNQINA